MTSRKGSTTGSGTNHVTKTVAMNPKKNEINGFHLGPGFFARWEQKQFIIDELKGVLLLIHSNPANIVQNVALSFNHKGCVENVVVGEVKVDGTIGEVRIALSCSTGRHTFLVKDEAGRVNGWISAFQSLLRVSNAQNSFLARNSVSEAK